jgi:ParB family transcriptional regulator, chromosome partitioning protein
MALIENLQREDLNAIEEAEAYERLIKEYNLTQEEVSTAVGKSRSAVANSIRLLCLSEKIRGFIVSGQLSSGHARALIVVEDKDLQLEIAEEVIKNSLNVRETEKLVKKYLSKKPAKKTEKKNEVIIELEDRLKNIFGTKVQILSNNKKGKIMIEYYSNDELDRILEMCGNISKK